MNAMDGQPCSRGTSGVNSTLQGLNLLRYRRFAAILVAASVFLGTPTAGFADGESEVAALEAHCEADRQAKIKPLRDALIAKCNAVGRNEPGYCERFWSDYGNAVRRPDGTMMPRMFHDLPSCLKAFEARKELNRDGS